MFRRHSIVTTIFCILCFSLIANADELVGFHDDFDDGLDPAWQMGDVGCNDDAANWFFKEGQLCAEVEGYEKCGVVVVGEDDWSNYEISYEVTLEEGADRIAVVHWQDLDHCLQVNLTHWLDAVVFVAGKREVIFRVPYKLHWGHTYEVRFGIRGSVARVWVDGNPVGKLDVSPWIDAGIVPKSGKAGLLTWSGGGIHQYEYICFDNFDLHQLDPEIGVAAGDHTWGAMKACYR